MMVLATAFQALVTVVVLLQLQPGSAQISISPDTIFRPGELVEIVLGRDNYSEVRVREEVIVKIDCSHQLQQFVRTQAITNVSRVTIQWLLQGQLPTLDGFSTQTITLSSGGRIDIVGGFNEIVNITGTQIPTGAVDGTTGIYTCKVCRDRDTPREVCVNSSLPVEGRLPPPDINNGQPGDTCRVLFGSAICNVGTNYCIAPSIRSILLSCFHNTSAPFTPQPIGVWFVNGMQINSATDGTRLSGTNPRLIPLEQGRRLRIVLDGSDQQGNYTCQLRNDAGSDTETSFITDCRMGPVIQPGRRINSSHVQVGFGPLCLTSIRVTITCLLEAEANPPINYAWSRNGVMLSETSDRLVVNRAGVYTCVATNNISNNSASSDIKSVPQFDVQIVGLKGRGCTRLDPIPPMLPEAFCAFVGDKVMFDCSAQFPIQAPNRQTLPQLSMINITADDAGSYTCSERVGGCSTSVSLIVFDPARVDTEVPLPDGPPGTTVIGAGRPVDPVMILRGRRVRLICPTTGLELPETFWQRRVGNNVTRVIENSPKIELRVDIGRGMSTVTLAIRDFQREDEGEYICITRNSGGTDQADVTLELETREGNPPLIITDPPDRPRRGVVTIGNDACLNENEIIALNCSLKQGSQPVVYKWTQNGETVPSTPPGHLLLVGRPGTYKCSVSNSFGADSATSVIKGPPAHDFFVTVIGGRDGGCSRLLTPPKDVDICAFPGETVTFTCLLPPRSISSTPVITTPYGVQAPSQFYLSNCHNEINGQYNCSTSNECGASSSTVTVQVYEPAKIHRKLEGLRQHLPPPMRNVTRVLVGRMEDTVDLRATENVQLYCPFSGIEEPTVIWLREGRDGAPHELVRPSPRIKLEKITLAGFTTSILSISNLQDGDFGEYVCHVHNKAGTDYDTVTLREVAEWYAGPWSKWTHVRSVRCVGVSSGQLLSDNDCSAEDMPVSRSTCGDDEYTVI